MFGCHRFGLDHLPLNDCKALQTHIHIHREIIISWLTFDHDPERNERKVDDIENRNECQRSVKRRNTIGQSRLKFLTRRKRP